MHKRGRRAAYFCLFGGWLAVTFVKTAKDMAIVAMEYELETAPKLSNGRPLSFLPRDAMHKRGLCRHAVYVIVYLSVSLCVCHVRELCQNE